MHKLDFVRKRVRGGIVRILVDGQFAGEIATCKWGFGLRLPGVFWDPKTGTPARGGFTQRGFRRQKDAVAFVRTLPESTLSVAAMTCAEHNLQMA